MSIVLLVMWDWLSITVMLKTPIIPHSSFTSWSNMYFTIVLIWDLKQLKLHTVPLIISISSNTLIKKKKIMITNDSNEMNVIILFACRDGEELDSQGDASSQPDTISIASRTSQNTLDSDKVTHTQMHNHPSKCYEKDTSSVLFYFLASVTLKSLICHYCASISRCHTVKPG